MNHRAPQSPLLETINRYSQRIAYLGLALVIALVFFLNKRTQNQNERIRCEAGVDNRNVSRATVQEIYRLNLSFINPKQHYNKEEMVRVKDFLKNLNRFRTTMYSQIKPSPLCAPYVNDDHVRPPNTPNITTLNSNGVPKK